MSGANIDELMAGAASGRKRALENSFADNDAMQYAAVRNILLRKGKEVEIVANYEPTLHYISEWWKQLYGESEGKDQRGILPAAVDLTTDLHSMGQFIQDGARIMFETVLNVPEAAPAINSSIFAPLTAIGSNPTAVNTEKRPPTSSGTTKLS